jgi:hypothetical protein
MGGRSKDKSAERSGPSIVEILETGYSGFFIIPVCISGK